MTTKPPYPTDAAKLVDYGSCYDGACECYEKSSVNNLLDSIEYYLTPRKCSEQAPEFPCLLWNRQLQTWDRYTHEPHYMYSLYPYWLPLPPAPEES